MPSHRTIVELVIVISIPAVFLLLPFFPVAHWSGQFSLRIDVQSAQQLDPDKVRIATVMRTSEVDYALQDKNAWEFDFQPGQQVGANQFEIGVVTDGKSGFFGLENAYYQPAWLVIEYVRPDDGKTIRAKFELPDGRKTCQMAVKLP